MSMTLEQAIEHAEDTAKSAIGCECRDEHRQLAEWLKELAERRKLPEIIRCGECVHSNKEYSGEMWCGICNGFGIDENSFCSFSERRTE